MSEINVTVDRVKESIEKADQILDSQKSKFRKWIESFGGKKTEKIIHVDRGGQFIIIDKEESK